MAKKTLLEIVQGILSDINSDNVDSITDTEDSEQCAQIVRSTYEALINGKNWPHTRRLIQIDASGNDALPTHMYLKDSVKELLLINYDKRKVSDGARTRFEPVKYLDPDNFLRVCNIRDNTESNVIVITDPGSLIKLNIRDDLAPTYFTSFDDSTLIFDSYDSAVDDTLQKSKIQAYGYVIPAWVHEDDAIPDLPEEAFSLLIEEAKSASALRIAKEADQKAEQESRRQRNWIARKDWTVAGGIKFPNYGRRSYKGTRDVTFRRD